MEVCSATAADDDALALRIDIVDVEDDGAAAALQIAVNNVMSIRDSFNVFILLSDGRVHKLSVTLYGTIVDGIVMVILLFSFFISSFLPSLKKIARKSTPSARDIKVEKDGSVGVDCGLLKVNRTWLCQHIYASALLLLDVCIKDSVHFGTSLFDASSS